MTRNNGQALSIAISGLRGTGRTSLYQQLESVLPKEFRGCEFEFLGNPFQHLPHPILWTGHKKRGVSRLFDCWGWLNDFTEEKWLPALQAGKIPVMDGCGLDAVLYATACIGCINDDEKVMEYHRDWVQDRIVKQKISPPRYLITRADVKRTVNFLTRTVDTLTAEQAREFIDKERAMIQQYFTPGHGQHPPHYLAPTMSVQEMTRESLVYIRQHLGLVTA